MPKSAIVTKKQMKNGFGQDSKMLSSRMPQSESKSEAYYNEGRLPQLIFIDILATACQYISPPTFFNDYFPKTWGDRVA
ncbi:MAG: hypothetical protein ABFS18_11070 [Thermodesulfobacteriota bacterium]